MRWQSSEYVRANLMLDRQRHGLLCPKRLDERRDLFSQEDPQQSHQGDYRRRRGAHVEERIDDADEQTKRKGNDVWLHE